MTSRYHPVTKHKPQASQWKILPSNLNIKALPRPKMAILAMVAKKSDFVSLYTLVQNKTFTEA